MAAAEARSAASGPVDLQQALQVATDAARAAGALIVKTFNESKHVYHKGKVDLVTETDQQCEALIFKALRSAFPECSFIGEEGSAAQGYTSDLTDAPTWLVDPVDGTTNFVHRQPYVCVCIGLAVNKEVVVGVVLNPISDELFTAVRGGGAHRNGIPIHVTDTAEIGCALIATEVGVTRDVMTVAALFDRISRVAAATRGIRCLGSCALNLCGVAMGRLDAFYEIGFGGPWDVAAAALILEEAGGQLGDPAGGPFDIMGRRVLGANGHLRDQLAQIIAQAQTSPAEPQPRA
eukprot:CAMPEP_0206149766 /NCGR_PEP_ID=MMETSP1473-20131121/37949_1 /ASSEMBLY_ACC=CAM_ASM_001109 /TAXON_ID=1461547 /ORGANISM="Stichococcus sp, Strain RCC1054" /LENGTH=290 /DNA_ID=CAMNT_0053547247 /DNA_START=251 /DNA_END=1123 /DNA_ORIENTATION=+